MQHLGEHVRLPVRWMRRVAAAAYLLAAFEVHADSRPTAAMWLPVRQLANFMSKLPSGEHAAVLARSGICIVENYPPFLFCGPNAARLWEDGFRRHSAEDELSALEASFGEPQDFSQYGRRAYFSLPTTWIGRTHGRPFEEHGVWAFVLERERAEWRIKGYGWGVSAYQESK